jgi:hypothetical protein
MKSNKTKNEILKDAFGLFINNTIPDEIFNGYIDDKDGNGSFELQYWIVNHMKDEISDWCTGIGIIEAVEHLYKTALENGNI